MWMVSLNEKNSSTVVRECSSREGERERESIVGIKNRIIKGLRSCNNYCITLLLQYNLCDRPRSSSPQGTKCRGSLQQLD